jgi:hypothetical protein
MTAKWKMVNDVKLTSEKPYTSEQARIQERAPTFSAPSSASGFHGETDLLDVDQGLIDDRLDEHCCRFLNILVIQDLKWRSKT